MSTASGAVAEAQSASPAELPPAHWAGLVLAGLSWLAARGLRRPSVAEVVAEAGVSRARAYEVRSEILDVIPSVVRRVGRPARELFAAPDPEGQARQFELLREAYEYLLDHPGAAEAGPRRRHYTDAFRRYVLELRERYQDVTNEEFARTVGVPLRTLSDWTASGLGETAPEPPPSPSTPAEPARMQRIQSILSAWKGWEGSFVAFCTHVEEHLRIPYKRTLIARILEEHGLRKPRRRPGRSPDELALRKQFETFFPGAQWSEDGTPLTVEVVGERFTFNVELAADPASGAFCGLSVRGEEDGQAVVEAFDDAVEETGDRPIALLLDNRPSNHTEEVADALGETIRIRSTQGRPQNKAHSEGGFGLFSQIAPPLEIPTLRLPDLARLILVLVVTTWARTLNNKPRRDRGNRSRVELYRAADPTPEEIEHARRELEERARKQEQARRTLMARQDPTVRKVLSEAFERLELDDPEGHLLTSIARYPLDHVVEGLAIFEGKRAAGTLPDGVDARYLLGIVRNISQEDEGIHIAETLWRGRLAARDEILVGLDHQRKHAVAAANDPLELTCRLVDLAMASTRTIDRSFWLRALADAIAAEPEADSHPLFRVAARRIHATHSVPHKERLAATRRVAAMLRPLI